MKKIFTLLMFFVAVGVFSQQKVAEKVAEYKQQKAMFREFTVLDATPQALDADVSKVLNKATQAKIRTSAVNEIVAQQYETIEVKIPYMGSEIAVELYKVELFNEAFHIDTDKARNIEYQRGVYYRGIVKNDMNSVVAMSFFNNELSGIVSGASVNNLVIGKQQKQGNTTDYLIYSDAEMKILSDFNCGMKTDVEHESHEHDHDSESADRSALSTRCVTVYFEIDYDLYQANGSNTTTTGNWMTSVFNNVSTLYANDGITVSLRSTFIWTEDDPYEGDSSGDYLFQFNQVRPIFDGDVGQLLGIDPGGLGGVAVTINGLCSANNFSYSDVNFGFSTVPTFSWTVQVITHELGHLLGSQHTHSCAWNGNGTSIDGCGTQAGFQEGNCAIGPIPSSAVKGTIMSYCHLISGVGINFANGFGPQPAARILTAVNGSNCLSTDCINTCINMVSNIEASDITTNGATITWDELGAGTSWQILVNAFAANFGTYTTVNETTYSVSNLQPNTFYKARIRPVCGTGMASATRQVVFATPGNWCNGLTITDTGGVNGDYTNEQNYTRVMIPTLPNKKIRLTFTSFDLEADYDYIWIYDGPSTSSTNLTPGGLTGENVPGPFEPYISTSPDGALTLQFFSDQGVVESGYAAAIACDDMLGIDSASPNIDFTYYPNPARDAVNIVSQSEISSIEVYNVTGQLLYSNKLNALQAKVDISAYSTGTYFFKLKFGEIGANFKILKF